MQVDMKAIYIDREDEAIAISIALQVLDKVYKEESARWFWLPSEWSSYIVQRAALQKRLRKLQEN